MKNIYFIILAIIIIIYILSSVRKNKLSIKTSFVWIVYSIIMLFLAIFPKSLDWLSNMLGISYPPALFLTLCILLILLQNFNFSKKIENQNEKIIELEQNLALLKEENKK